MKVSHVGLFVLVCDVALCSAKSLNGARKWRTGDHLEPPPVSVGQINTASANLKRYFPGAEGWLQAIDEELGKTKADADPIKGLEAFLHTMNQLYNVTMEAYKPFQEMLYSMIKSGFAWERYINYQQMAEKWGELAESGKFNEKLATQEITEAFKEDIQRIRDEISWAKTEVINNFPEIDQNEPPKPLFVTKEIGTITYVLQKVERDVATLVRIAPEFLEYIKTHARSWEDPNSVEEALASEVRSLMAELKTYQLLHTENAKKS